MLLKYFFFLLDFIFVPIAFELKSDEWVDSGTRNFYPNRKTERIIPASFSHCGPFRVQDKCQRFADVLGYEIREESTVTYDHRLQEARDPVRSPKFKLMIGGSVVRWETTSEYPLLYVFWHF